MALGKAKKNIAYAKVGIYGDAGSGKTRTATEIAIGLIKANKLNPVVAMFDTEPAHQFLIPIFEKNGVELLVEDKVSRSFVSLMKFMSDAMREKASVIIIDSISHVWQELQKAQLDKLNEGRARYNKKPINKLEFQHWGAIKEEWRTFTDLFLSCEAHVIVCGRAASVYEYQENEETGKKELITNGTKMATEKEMGYEPSLLIQMIKYREKGKIVNTAIIEKDRADALNGNEIPFPNFTKLKKHFDFINLGGEQFKMNQEETSKELFDSEEGDSQKYKEKHQRTFYLGEIKELLEAISGGGTSKEAKEKKRELIQKYNSGCMSWESVEKLWIPQLKELYQSLYKEYHGETEIIPDSSDDIPDDIPVDVLQDSE